MATKNTPGNPVARGKITFFCNDCNRMWIFFDEQRTEEEEQEQEGELLILMGRLVRRLSVRTCLTATFSFWSQFDESVQGCISAAEVIK